MAKKPATRSQPPARRSVVGKLLMPVQEFIRTESSSGIILIAAAVVAFAWANSPWAQSYFALLDLRLGVSFAAWGLEKPLLLWVNDLLMAVFFFLVGLEIKREVVVGELAGWQRAALPAAGALGGMVVPALIYLAFTAGQPTMRGWGVPMATDIAFALGVMALLGSRVPLSLKVFLLALAIVDDLGAILVIALFYTEDLQVGSLVISLLVWAVAVAYGRASGEKPLVFALLGLVMWYFMLRSGIHATIAGVLMALTVPLRHKLAMQDLQHELRALGTRGAGFEQVEVMIEHLEGVLAKAHSPLHNMEHALAPYVAFVIMPVFAFFNAGVPIAGGAAGMISAVSLGTLAGLLIGKPLGVAGFAFIAVKSGLARLPAGATWSGMVGVGLLAGIGFTMSLFIANLAFEDPTNLVQAKIGVLTASVVAALAGLFFLSRALPQRQSVVPAAA
jgi:Na+:H+ antiporter, NhaA family